MMRPSIAQWCRLLEEQEAFVATAAAVPPLASSSSSTASAGTRVGGSSNNKNGGNTGAATQTTTAAGGRKMIIKELSLPFMRQPLTDVEANNLLNVSLPKNPNITTIHLTTALQEIAGTQRYRYTRTATPLREFLLRTVPAKLPALRHLRLVSNNLEGELHGRWIAHAVRNSPRLVSLHLQMNRLGDEGMHALAEHGLKGNRTLQELYVNDNRIRVQGCRSFACIMNTMTSLRSLSFSGNPIGENGAKFLASGIIDAAFYKSGGGRLEELHLADCCIGNRGCFYIARSLRRREIVDDDESVEENQQQRQQRPAATTGAVALAHPTRAANNSSSSNNNADKLAPKRVEFFTPPLKLLSIPSNGIGGTGFAYLANALKSNNTLAEIYAYDNKCQDFNNDFENVPMGKAIKCIIEALRHANYSVEVFDLREVVEKPRFVRNNLFGECDDSGGDQGSGEEIINKLCLQNRAAKRVYAQLLDVAGGAARHPQEEGEEKQQGQPLTIAAGLWPIILERLNQKPDLLFGILKLKKPDFLFPCHCRRPECPSCEEQQKADEASRQLGDSSHRESKNPFHNQLSQQSPFRARRWDEAFGAELQNQDLSVTSPFARSAKI